MLVGRVTGNVAVSYTHLDVYKRQTEDDVRRAAQRGYRIIRYAPDAILTPLARDIAAEKRIELASAVH